MILGVPWYVTHSHQLYVEQFLFDAIYSANNRKLLLFTFSHAIQEGSLPQTDRTSAFVSQKWL